MNLRIEIQSHDWVERELFGRPRSLAAGARYEIPGTNGAILTYHGAFVRKADSLPRIVEIVLSVSHEVAVGLVVAWLYDKLRGRTERLRTENTEVRVEEGEITRVVQPVIDREH